MNTLMSIVAHPDDASIWWGGTIAKHAAEGWQVVSVVVDEGRGSPHSFEMDAHTLVATRAKELQWESLRLGAQLEHLSLPGVKTPELRADCLEQLVALLNQHQPQRIITHHFNDAHATHVRVAQLAFQAMVQAADNSGYALPEVWQGDGWEPVHYPNLRVNVTPFMNIKMAAISMHGSQIFDTPYVMAAWGMGLFRAGFAASHEVTDPSCLFAEAFTRVEADAVRALAAANDPEA